MTQTQPTGQAVAPHPSRLSVESNASTVDVEKARVSIDSTSDENTIRIPFSAKRTSRKLFCGVLIAANIMFIAVVVGLAVGLSLRLKHSGSESGSSTPAGAENVSHGGGSGPNRVY
ncbi:uncharacterized protein DFL_000021 [Arthrobotrys flagrans]|uniref:Uncharacterized protein n=1 Tax=Arthrobotrys flagrans TaxID=97331 RepID=A0A437ADX5_ARTFL|nr:hypothetical protein DFL_000021 [Arthrobotrys flagrans]